MVVRMGTNLLVYVGMNIALFVKKQIVFLVYTKYLVLGASRGQRRRTFHQSLCVVAVLVGVRSYVGSLSSVKGMAAFKLLVSVQHNPH